MTTLKFLSTGLVATAMLLTPAIARESHMAKRQAAADSDAGAFPEARDPDGRLCIPAPRVGAFATAPWTGDNVPCEPEWY